MCGSYDVCRRHCGMVGKWKNKSKARNEKDWEEEVYMKSTLK